MTGATSKCICGVQPPENDLTTIFVCYFLHVRSSVASDETQLGLRLDLLVSLDVVKGGRVKVDLHQLEG